MRKMDIDELKIVSDDLEYLASWGPDITDREIRQGSAILRRLIVEDVYGHAWRSIGKAKQPKLIAVDIEPNITSVSLSEIVYALALGAQYRGLFIASMMTSTSQNFNNNLSLPQREDGYPGEREFTLSDYRESISGVSEGEIFKRREVIKYLANVKGGVHLSQKVQKNDKDMMRRMKRIEKRIMIHKSDGLFVELVAIGQALGRSIDAKEFIDSVKPL